MDQDKHQRAAEKRNQGYQKKQAKATKEKGLFIINTGTGKGKTSAAMGMVVRGVGHGMKVGVVQFIKGAMDTAERTVLNGFDNVDFHSIGDGFTWITQNRDQDVATANKAWQLAKDMLEDSSYDMVVLDELNIILKYDYIDTDDVLAVINARNEMMHVIVTGRHAKESLIESADMVNEIRPVKHPYKEQGVKAQKGIEF